MENLSQKTSNAFSLGETFKTTYNEVLAFLHYTVNIPRLSESSIIPQEDITISSLTCPHKMSTAN